uniref:Uncharacterized protein n=1 Tax=Amphimedon queenslandica TaxID=400682 RepID=A0A1X7TL67_AMPQE
MSSYLLLVLLVCFMSNGILLEVNGESCTEGFMDYSLLQGKATTPMGNLRNNRLSNYKNPSGVATRWIIIKDNIKFTCATVITEILIGVDIRTVNNLFGRNLYPRFEVWAPANNMNSVYTRVMSDDIRLTPDNFTTNGQYRFTLPTPLNVSSGYRIGVYQPSDDKSVVRFHYMNLRGMVDKDRTGKVQSNYINNNNITISGGGRQVDREEVTILIYPIVQNTSCFPQFVPDDMINSLSYAITNSYYVSDTRIFPDIRFTCHGIITNWIVNIPAQVMPVIKIRHSNNLTTTALTININDAVSISQYLYNFTMSNEIPVQPGDILMIESNLPNYMYYQQYNGPHNYRLVDNNELIALDDNDYPLISVVVEPISVTTTVTSSNYITTSTTSSIATSDTTSLSLVMRPPYSSSMAMYTTTVTAVPTITTAAVPTDSITTDSITTASISITSSLSTTITSTPGQGNAGNGASIILIAAISAVIVLLVATIIVILIVSVVLFRKKRKLSLPVSSTRNDSNSSHVYTDVSSTGNDKGRLGAVNNPNYQLQGINNRAFIFYMMKQSLH